VCDRWVSVADADKDGALGSGVWGWQLRSAIRHRARGGLRRSRRLLSDAGKSQSIRARDGRLSHMTIEETSIVERGGLLFTRVDDDLLALDPQAGCYYSLNRPAARVWELIDSPTPVSILCDQLIGEYEVDRATCLGDVIELIDELRAAKLVKVESPGRSSADPDATE